MMLDEIISLLQKISTSSKEERAANIKKLQNIIWNDNSISDDYLNNVLTDIAYILDFYESDARKRKESPNYYDDIQLMNEIKLAAQKIEDYKSNFARPDPKDNNS